MKILKIANTLLLFTLFSCKKEIIQYSLLTSVEPVNSGVVTPSNGTYENGQRIDMIATPSGEYVFKEWKGDLASTRNPETLIFDKNKQVLGSFEKRQYPLNLTIEGNGTVKEEIISIGTNSVYPSGTTVRLTPKPLIGWQFEGWSGDIVTKDSILQIKVNQQINLKLLFVRSEVIGLKILNKIDSLAVSQVYEYKVGGILKNGSVIDITNEIIIDGKSENINKLSNNKITISKSGVSQVQIKYNNLILVDKFYSKSYFYNNIPDELKSDKKCSKEVNVAILRILATKDGVKLDETKGPDSPWAYNYPSLDIQRQKFNDDNIITKNAVEYGTRFRDYGTGKVNKYVCLNTVAYIDVFEYQLVPYNINSEAQKTIDFKELFERINMKSLVNNQNVKEVWMNILYKGNMNSVKDNKDDDWSTYWNIQESNMSSPSKSGDISNSNRDNSDLPIYNSTYVVYAHYGTAGAETNLHTRGHQIEAQLYYLDKTPLTVGLRKKLFSDLFVGSGNGKDNMPLGRVGMTHFPPNTIKDYDYDNSNLVESDILDWVPSETGGSKSLINSNSWKRISYPFNMGARFTQKCGNVQCVVNYNNDPHFMWLLYWFQSIPGENNKIPFVYQNTKYELENWWDLFYNWDDAIKNNKTLWK